MDILPLIGSNLWKAQSDRMNADARKASIQEALDSRQEQLARIKARDSVHVPLVDPFADPLELALGKMLVPILEKQIPALFAESQIASKEIIRAAGIEATLERQALEVVKQIRAAEGRHESADSLCKQFAGLTGSENWRDVIRDY